MLSNDIDAAMVAASPGFHEEILAACISLAIPVFVEKPCARNLAEITRLTQYVSSNPGTLTFVGFNFRFTRAHKEMVRIAEQLGGIQHLEIEFLTNKPREPLWDYEDTFVSYMYAIAVHPLETAVNLIGTPVAVVTEFTRIQGRLFDFSVSLTSAHGKTAHLHLSNTAERFFRRYEISTVSSRKISTCTAMTNGRRLSGTLHPAEAIVYLDDGDIDVLLQPDDLGYIEELRSFANSILQGVPSSSPIEGSIPVYQIIRDVIAARPKAMGSDPGNRSLP